MGARTHFDLGPSRRASGAALSLSWPPAGQQNVTRLIGSAGAFVR